jgi:hypothetical protein
MLERLLASQEGMHSMDNKCLKIGRNCFLFPLLMYNTYSSSHYILLLLLLLLLLLFNALQPMSGLGLLL